MEGQQGLRMEKRMISEMGSGPAMVRKLEVGGNDVFMVENYSASLNMRVGEAIKSEEFVACGRRWSIQFYPKGLNYEAEGFASLTFTQISNEKETPIDILYGLKLLGPREHYRHYCYAGRFGSKQVLTIRPGVLYGVIRFVSRGVLSRHDCPFLEHDSLKIRVVIGVFSYHIRDVSAPPSYIPSLYMRWALKWHDTYEMKAKTWDDEFIFIHVAESVTFCAAKFVLAAHCPTLLCYDDHHQLQDIVLPDMDSDVFRVALQYIYLGRTKDVTDAFDPIDDQSFAGKLLAAANQLGLKGLKKMCEVSISKKISRESVVSLLHLAHDCSAAKLKSACLNFAARNRLVIMECDGIEVLKETCPQLYHELAAGLGDNNPWAISIKR